MNHFESLPEVNPKRFALEEASLELNIEILAAIERVEKKCNYEFKPWELDIIYLSRIDRHQRGYVLADKGPEKIFK